MKKVLVGILLILFLLSCSGTKVNDVFDEIEVSKSYQSPTGAIPVETVGEGVQEGVYVETAGDIFDDLKSVFFVESQQVFEGNFYPQIETIGTGKDALREKTTALHQQIYGLPMDVKADREFGPRFYTLSKIKELEKEDN